MIIWPFNRTMGGRRQELAVVGAMRSGTNLVAQLVERNWNIKASINSYGWKHGGIPVFGPGSGLEYSGVPILYVVKNPYAFVRSLHRYLRVSLELGHSISLDGEPSFERFLKSPIYIWDSQLDGSPRMRFDHPVAYWNWFYFNLETLDNSRFSVLGINYEDVIADPDCLSVLEEVVSAKRLTQQIVIPAAPMPRRSAGRKKGGRGLQEDFDPDYYQRERYLAELTASQVKFISSHVDGWIMEQRGYVVL